MTRSAPVVLAVVVAASLGGLGAGLQGCSSPSSSVPSNVSFTKDVMPILQSSCGTTQQLQCHGDPGVVSGNLADPHPRPYLGPSNVLSPGPLSQQDLDSIYSGLMKNSYEAPTYPYVKPKSTSGSFLWHKIAGDQASLGSACAKVITPPCGLQMPNTTSIVLDEASVATLQGWIDEGAPEN